MQADLGPSMPMTPTQSNRKGIKSAMTSTRKEHVSASHANFNGMQNDAHGWTSGDGGMSGTRVKTTPFATRNSAHNLRGSYASAPKQDDAQSSATGATTVGMRSHRTAIKSQAAINTKPISVKDYVQFGLKGNQSFGIEGYAVAHTCELDKPRVKNIVQGKRQTYIDDEVRAKKFVPAANYEVGGSLIQAKKKSNIEKAPRRTMADDIAANEKKNSFPAPTSHKPSYSQTQRKDSACLNFKGDRVSFVNDAEWKGQSSADYHSKKHQLTEKRTQAPTYRAPGKHDMKGPSFLRQEVASKLISPVTYNHQESYMMTQAPKTKFFLGKGKNNSMVDQAIAKGKQTPGVGNYDLKSIDKGYQKTTLGASRGWK